METGIIGKLLYYPLNFAVALKNFLKMRPLIFGGPRKEK
jgi:hypothetical protein